MTYSLLSYDYNNAQCVHQDHSHLGKLIDL